MSVVIETTIGDITVDLYLETRPRTCLNFIKLCKIKYYNFCLFHKIERNFIAQTGDPSGTGRGGHSIFSQMYGEQAKYFEAENKPRIKHKKLGTLSMVNSGNNMNGSQFFITLGEDLTYLDEEHTVFGEVAEGFEILVKLNDTICDTNNRPYQDIRITHTVVLHDPYDDPSNLEIPPSSPIPTKEILASDYVGADEDIEDNKGRSMEEIEEEIKDKEAKARATILEMVGDIPDAEVKPPENVLFVCKLNPVTTNEDLEIIFSRFGVINSCEVIKDQKTGESLQYAFIEFDREEDCESAYFKMDNVLIDDRRIHVDFSQSVSKMKFDKQNRPIIERRDNRRKETLVIKDQLRKTGDYEMIFDSDGEGAIGGRDKKKDRGSKHSPSPRAKHKAKSPYDHSSKTKNRHRSPYQSSKSKHASESLSYNSSKSRCRSKSPPHNSSKSRHHSKSPSYNSSKSKYRSKSPSYKSSKSRHRSKSPPHNSSKSRHRSKSPPHNSSKSRHRSKSPPHNSSKSRHRSKSPSHNSSKSKYDKSSHHSSKSKLRSSSPRHKHKKSRKDLSSPEPNSPSHSLSKRKKHSHRR